jgi:hypothetical protein
VIVFDGTKWYELASVTNLSERSRHRHSARQDPLPDGFATERSRPLRSYAPVTRLAALALEAGHYRVLVRLLPMVAEAEGLTGDPLAGDEASGFRPREHGPSSGADPSPNPEEAA